MGLFDDFGPKFLAALSFFKGKEAGVGVGVEAQASRAGKALVFGQLGLFGSDFLIKFCRFSRLRGIFNFSSAFAHFSLSVLPCYNGLRSHCNRVLKNIFSSAKGLGQGTKWVRPALF